MRGKPGTSNKYINYATIKNCIIEDWAGESGKLSPGIFLQITKNILIDNCIIRYDSTNGSQTDGVYLGGCSSAEIRNNYIEINNDYSGTSQPHIDCIQVTHDSSDSYSIIDSKQITIKDNYLINLGVGIIFNGYNHRQGIIVSNTIADINIFNNNIVSSWGDNLINAYYESETTALKIYNNTLVSNGNPNHLMQITKSSGGNPSILKIKNNIFYKEGELGLPHLIAIKFAGMDSTEIDTSRLNNNVYYCSAYQGSNVYLNFNPSNSYLKPWNYYSPQGIKANPLFAQEGYKYRIEANSPAKNLGNPLAEITKDIEEIKRPYWKNGVDAGAFEVPEAQLKIGTSGVTQGTQITHYLSTFGTYWERENNAYPIQGSSQLTTSYQTIGNSPANKEYWGGFYLDWMRNTGNESSMTHAFYKVYNDSSDAYFYLDMRDAVYNYKINLYVQFTKSANEYKIFIDSSFYPISDGDIIRIYELNNGGLSNTEILSNYIENVLLSFEENNHPRLIWGPFAVDEYNIERNYDNEGYQQIAFISDDYEYLDEDITLPIGENEDLLSVLYKVTSDGYESNAIAYLIEKQKKISADMTKAIKYELLQNYPNPFNPATTIQFSIAKPENVTLKLYDILGRELKSIINEKLEAGTYNLKLNMANLASGIYIYRFEAGKFSSVKKMQLLK